MKEKKMKQPIKCNNVEIEGYINPFLQMMIRLALVATWVSVILLWIIAVLLSPIEILLRFILSVPVYIISGYNTLNIMKSNGDLPFPIKGAMYINDHLLYLQDYNDWTGYIYQQRKMLSMKYGTQ